MLEHRFIERNLNRLCALADKVGLPFTNTGVNSILAAARRGEGYDDWGSDDFIPRLERALRALDHPRFSPMAKAFIRGIGVRATRNRIKIERWFAEHPEAEDIEIKRPIFVLGFPRSGTTVLQNLLEQAPQRRALRFWELTAPVPTHPDFEQDRKNRIRRINLDLAFAYRVVPEMREVHEIKATTCEECWPLLSNTFSVVNFDICHGLADYGDWLNQQDMVWAYREYKRMLQMMLHRWPAEQLVLKCPEHLWFVDALMEVFPDACIVWTHRDPYDCVASYSSMISLARRTLQGSIHPPTIGAHITERFGQGVQRAMAARDRIGDESRFFDVGFNDLVDDRVGMVQRIEQHFGLEVSETALLQGWLDKKRADGRGRHRYDAAMWGLERDALHGHFAEYIDRFGVSLEKPD